jgi:hypothetical protein
MGILNRGFKLGGGSSVARKTIVSPVASRVIAPIRIPPIINTTALVTAANAVSAAAAADQNVAVPDPVSFGEFISAMVTRRMNFPLILWDPTQLNLLQSTVPSRASVDVPTLLSIFGEVAADNPRDPIRTYAEKVVGVDLNLVLEPGVNPGGGSDPIAINGCRVGISFNQNINISPVTFSIGLRTYRGASAGAPLLPNDMVGYFGVFTFTPKHVGAQGRLIIHTAELVQGAFRPTVVRMTRSTDNRPVLINVGEVITFWDPVAHAAVGPYSVNANVPDAIAQLLLTVTSAPTGTGFEFSSLDVNDTDYRSEIDTILSRENE